jgi:hypothetical protein
MKTAPLQTDLARGFAFLWLLAFWPAAYFVAGNFDQIADYSFEGVTAILLVSAAIPAAASLLAAGIWSLGRQRAAVIVLFASAALNPLLFCFRSCESAIVKLWAAEGLHHGMIVVYVALCGLLSLALGLALRSSALQRAAVFAAAIVLAVNGARIAVDAHAFQGASSLAEVPDALQAKRSPLHENIYYVLLDSYPGPVTTKRVFGFDNPLPAQLGRRGFFSAGDFRTNYFATMLTMSAVLDAWYDVTEASRFPVHGTEAYPIHLIGGYTPAAIKALKTIGFETVFLGNWYARCADKVFVCLDRWQISQSIPFGTFLDATPAARIFPPVVTMARAGPAPFDALYDAITPLTDSIPSLARHGRVFVFAHNMAPHPPTQYNADCTQSKAAPTVDLNWTGVEKDSYLAALQCVNRKMMSLIDAIDRDDPGALVVIQSDHGSFTQAHGHVAWDSLPAALRDELTWPINFIRAPAECRRWLYDGIAQVNTMRFMIGCAMREPPHYLTDDTYIGRGRGTGDGPFVLLARQGPRYGG